jgi:sarcosine oxidase/L-pipecolate oxidase
MKSVGLNLPLKTMPGHQIYFRAKDPVSHDVSSGMPIVLHELHREEGYQFVMSKPICEYPGLVKVATRGEPLIGTRHPDQRDFDFDDLTQLLVDYVTKHMPQIDPKPCIVDTGVYCMTPDRDYIIDRHPHMKNVLIGCGFSGHGFKMAPVIGKLLAEMVQDKPPSYDMTHFRVTRFTPNAKL